MKPIFSAAAAALLLLGARRGGSETPPHSESPEPADDDTDPPSEPPSNNPFADWDWSNSPDNSSIWTATAAVLSSLRSPLDIGSLDSESKDSPDSDRKKDIFEGLSAALRGLKVFSHNSTSSSDDEHSDDDPYDVRPLIAVTIGVTLFLLTRSPRASRRAELDAGAGDGTLVLDDEDIIPEPRDYSVLSDLRCKPRDIVVVTTAALPWMTGTAVNPLLRAVYLAKDGHNVSLVVPWLESPEDQRKVYPKGTLFTSQDEQEKVVLKWAREQVADVHIQVHFYEGVYSKEFGSILPLGDITAMFRDDHPRDVCILEEPEHLTWHHTGARWTSLFRFCVGVVHTNYIEYAKKHGVFGPQRALFLNFLNKWVCRSYCHRVIKLSDAVQTLPHSVTSNVHGVRNRFLDIGVQRNGKRFDRGAYFLGKVLWAKGYRQLVDLIEEHYSRSEERLPIDFFGAGPDLDAVKATVQDSYGLSKVQIHGIVVDHASEYLQQYKVYVNPSKSDVVCTATAEALAMGKFVVCLKHPSNEFFATFDNCLIYTTGKEFSEKLAYALANEPKPLSENDVFRLSWEAATERFYEASYVPAPSGSRGVDSALALTHKTICATLVTPPANNAVRARYRAEKRSRKEVARERKRRIHRSGRKVPIS
ncbi:Digalactosyldiacylglycerol synthase 1, chloroplastic [Gracilariopsis chorda]|uniref:Digalactosyldiacylglycerol synthase 1, chloroplastic n=1 Tax=Gracilariopsis chorda TaxID=448386 RepID=A0A2V3J2N3_9FLOR|nr:Digalactosyldiacylglycerol synthase 1, chloroplastic [Gracilariopsis chorda]|eukprot:PXF48257.1 Digalactosyldiacylglycerol synthase 1, chloroplastic [Gracilariopsis chorda]